MSSFEYESREIVSARDPDHRTSALPTTPEEARAVASGSQGPVVSSRRCSRAGG